MNWYETPNYGGVPKDAYPWLYHKSFGLEVGEQGGTHYPIFDKYKNIRDQLYTHAVAGRYFPASPGDWDEHASIYEFGNKDSGIREEAKRAVENHFSNQSTSKTASLPYKFVWADGQLIVAPGWRPDIHHMHMMQELGITQMPTNLAAGFFRESTLGGEPTLKVEEHSGLTPSDDQLVEMIREYLQGQQHIGRLARKPW